MSTPAQQAQHPESDVLSTDELIRRQGVRPLRSLDDLITEDPFESDEEHEAFLADLYASRRADS